MEVRDQDKEQDKEMESSWKEIEKTHRRGKIMGGLLVTAVGSIFLAKELGAEIPSWLFTWKMLLIALGVVTAVKHKFMHPGWLVLVAVGGAFLMNDIYPEMHLRPFLWPVLIIMVGLFIIFKPSRKAWKYDRNKQHMRQYWANWHKHHHHQHRRHQHRHRDFFDAVSEEPDSEDYIESTTCFGGVKKNIFSKKFKGGDVTNIFGGTELNLMQADIEGQARLEVTQVMGGTKLIVPAHWEIKSEIVAILGSVEDKRPVNPLIVNDPPKILVLVGTTVMGGIEIRTY